MPNKPVVQIDGLRDFRRDLKHAPADVTKELQAELKTIAQRVAAEAGSRAPRGVTGKLSASYRGRASQGLRGTVTNTQFYGRFIEFGHNARDGSFVEGRHVVGSVLADREDEIVDDVGDAFERAAGKAFPS